MNKQLWLIGFAVALLIFFGVLTWLYYVPLAESLGEIL